MNTPSFLKRKNLPALAYHRLEGNGPGIVFLGGFRSDMTGSKACALADFCAERGQAFVRFDYRGHGQSEGEFAEGTIGKWKQDATDILTKLTSGPQILIGSSMGGWLALLLALDKPRRVAGLIGIAAAPDFTENLMWDQLTAQQKKRIETQGSVIVPSAMGDTYPITRELIEDGRAHLLLPHRHLPIDCPVRLIHGMNDADVPWEVSLAINEKVTTKDVKLFLVDGGDHRLSGEKDIARMHRVIQKMLETLANAKAA
jgi:pimeloyl-ACP methyl ester carboxylesterase